MLIVKKLLFAIPFLLFCGWFSLQLAPTLNNPSLIFAWDTSTLFQLLYLIASLFLTSLFFIIFATLAGEWKIVIPVTVMAASLPLLAINPAQSSFLIPGFLAAFFISYFLLNQALSSYLAFKPNSLLGSPVNRLMTLLLLVLSLEFYFNYAAEIETHGFKIPDSLIDSALKFIPAPQLPQLETQQAPSSSPSVKQPQLPQITAEQIQLLRQNPALLKQYGLDLSTLDQLEKAQIQGSFKPAVRGVSSDQQLIKAMVSTQLETILKPYSNFIPLVLALLFFFTLKSLAALFSLLLSPLLLLIFYILEKTGLTHYTSETREVKKLVV